MLNDGGESAKAKAGAERTADCDVVPVDVGVATCMFTRVGIVCAEWRQHVRLF